jgi:uncharacterized protein (DUF885 family)
MNLPYKLVLLSLIALVFIGCKPSSTQEMMSSTERIDSLFEEYYHFKLSLNPIEGTKAGMNEYDHVLANYISEEFKENSVAQYTKFLHVISSLDVSELSESQQMSLKVMEWDCIIKRDGLNNPISTVASPMFDLPNVRMFPINQIFSFHLYIATLADVGGAHPFKSVTDYESWLQRVDDFVIWLETAQANMQKGIDQQVVLPKVIIERMIGQLDQFTNPNIEEHIYYGAIKNMPPSIEGKDRERLDKAYRHMIASKLIPAFTNLKTFLTDVYLPAGVETAGIGALPNGEATYKYLIKYHTTTTMTPDEIFKLGQQEVERISGEMEKVKEQVGFEGDLKAFFNHVRTSKVQMPFTEPQQVIDNFNAIHEKMKTNLSKLFDLTPKAAFEVRRTQAFREASASAEYEQGSKDGSRPGVFYVPIPKVEAYNKFSDEALFLHEAIPGHHYQLSLQQENETLPEFLHSEGLGVYVEGWALYSESLGSELGLYTDAYQYFGMLSMEMHRAIRLVVDVGLHAKGWTRQEAIQYSLDHEAESESGITSEIERYMVAPGQALSYKIGQLKIRELRARAEKALGEKFSIKEFHNQVLGSGSLPLVLLEEKIDKWIKSQE